MPRVKRHWRKGHMVRAHKVKGCRVKAHTRRR